jgi:hypothetical protein
MVSDMGFEPSGLNVVSVLKRFGGVKPGGGIPLREKFGYTPGDGPSSFGEGTAQACEIALFSTIPALGFGTCPLIVASAYPPTSGFSRCPRHSSDNGPQTSPEPARALDQAKQLTRLSICRHLGRPMRLSRNRPGTQQSFTP